MPVTLPAVATLSPAAGSNASVPPEPVPRTSLAVSPVCPAIVKEQLPVVQGDPETEYQDGTASVTPVIVPKPDPVADIVITPLTLLIEILAPATIVPICQQVPVPIKSEPAAGAALNPVPPPRQLNVPKDGGSSGPFEEYA
jgi:hypothetical protein